MNKKQREANPQLSPLKPRRIRQIRPDIWEDERLASVSFPARLLYIGLRNFSDRDGRFEWLPATLRIRILPHDAIDVSALLDELSAPDLICRYSVGGQDYGHIVDWHKNQLVEAKEPRVYPAPSTCQHVPACASKRQRRSICICIGVCVCGRRSVGGSGSGSKGVRVPSNLPVNKIADETKKDGREGWLPLLSRIFEAQTGRTFVPTKDETGKLNALAAKYGEKLVAAAFLKFCGRPEGFHDLKLPFTLFCQQAETYMIPGVQKDIQSTWECLEEYLCEMSPPNCGLPEIWRDELAGDVCRANAMSLAA